MCRLPRLFLYRSIIGRCWSGVIKVHSSEVSWFWGCRRINLLKKLLFQGNLCSPGVDERVWLQEQKPWGIFVDPEVPKTFFGLRWPRLLANLGVNPRRPLAFCVPAALWTIYNPRALRMLVDSGNLTKLMRSFLKLTRCEWPYSQT
jgi:hypothetical protein